MSLVCRNESEVGAAIKKSGLPREDIFVTTKVARINSPIYVHLCCGSFSVS